MPNNRAIMPISTKLLANLLGLPNETTVEAVFQSDNEMDQIKGVCRLVISHPDLPEVGEECLPPIINPQFYNDGGEAILTHWSDGIPAQDAQVAILTKIAELQKIYRQDDLEAEQQQAIQGVIEAMSGNTSGLHNCNRDDIAHRHEGMVIPEHAGD